MNKLAIIVFFITIPFAYSQNMPDYEQVKAELTNSENLLNLKFTVPQSDFYFVIENGISFSRYFGVDPCTEIKADYKMNKRIQEILDNNQLFKIISALDGDELSRIDPNEEIEIDAPLFHINVVYKTDNKQRSLFLPVLDKDQATKILTDFNQLFPNENCFSILKDEI